MGDKADYLALNSLSFSLVKNRQIIFLAVLLVAISFGGAVWLQADQIEKQTRNYVASWEDDLAKSLLLEKQASLLDKILSHVLERDVKLSSLQILAPANKTLDEKGLQSRVLENAACLKRFDVPVTLYGLPAAQMQFCEPAFGLLGLALFSPIFLGTLLLGFLLLWYFGVETGRLHREKTSLQSKVVLHEDLSRISRQVAHDIRSPLSALQMVLSLNPDEGRQDERNRILHTAVDRIRGISNDLFINGRMSLEGQASLRQLRESFGRLKIELQTAFADQTWDWYEEEKTEGLILPLRLEVWERILQNLLRNAAEANRTAHDKRVRVTIARNGAHIVISVADSGPGIPAEVQDRVGTEGFTHGKDGGTGLGLAFVRRHLESAQGELSFARPWSGGFEVRVTCPILRSQSQAGVPGTA